MLCASEADKKHILYIAIMELLFFALDSFVFAARDGVSMSRTADPRITSNGLGVLVPMSDRLAPCIDDLPLFKIVHKTNFYPVLVYVAFCRWQEVDWSCIHLEDPVFSYRWFTG